MKAVVLQTDPLAAGGGVDHHPASADGVGLGAGRQLLLERLL